MPCDALCQRGPTRMRFSFEPMTLALAFMLALGIAAIAGVFVAARSRERRAQCNIAALNTAIVEYFRRTGVEVTAGCASLLGDGRYIAVIESEPMKRFRLSHIIEMTLRDHVRKTCGVEIDKVYW